MGNAALKVIEQVRMARENPLLLSDIHENYLLGVTGLHMSRISMPAIDSPLARLGDSKK